MLIITSEKLYGVEYETLDVVFGVTTHSKNIVKNIGADAIIAMRFDSGSISNDMQSVVAYGTAVKFKNQ
ncbi:MULTISPECIES: heavy metal-binding domain-containing protein [Enterococcus]|uniref:heavy metal-binding domain-containing protein n=1 Tax=Enterococcus TaxID=1350 RepID=UPI003F26BD5D